MNGLPQKVPHNMHYVVKRNMEKTYYTILTKKFTLRTSHEEWIRETQELYNEILKFYYQIILEYSELTVLDNQKLLRELEKMTIVGRDKKDVPHPLTWKKVPLYFRRAAINDAIAAAKSYLSREEQLSPTQQFFAGILLYKGTYKELDSKHIVMRVFGDERWQWIRCRLSGNALSKDALWLSPRVVCRERKVELHIPVRENVSDGRTLKKRMDSQLKICSLQFSNRDAFVICCSMDREGDVLGAKFIRGGNNYRIRCQRYLTKIEKSRKATKGDPSNRANMRYWKKLKNMSDDMAHQASHEIIDFCRDSEISVLVLPKYGAEYTKRVMMTTGFWSPVYLSYKIVDKLKYKAWNAGILVVEVEASNISKYCSICQSNTVFRGEMMRCESGHQMNRRLNSARNLGKKFLKNMAGNHEENG